MVKLQISLVIIALLSTVVTSTERDYKVLNTGLVNLEGDDEPAETEEVVDDGSTIVDDSSTVDEPEVETGTEEADETEETGDEDVTEPM